MKIETIKVVQERPVGYGKLLVLESGKEVFVKEGFVYIEIELLEGNIQLTVPAEGELRVFDNELDLLGNSNSALRISYNPTRAENTIIEHMEKLYPESPLGEPTSISENLWEVYSTFRSYATIEGGTVEFNKEGNIERLIAHFKTNNNG